MEAITIKETAVAKLLELPPEGVSKVLIFMAGLDAGVKLNTDDIFGATSQKTALTG